MTNNTPPSWARVEAKKRLNAEWVAHNPGRRLPVYFDGDYTVTVLARHIAKHEQPPEDSDLATAWEAAARDFENRCFPELGGLIRSGDYPCREIDLALAAIKLHKERNP